jgi:excisionase family DNA binding protein
MEKLALSVKEACELSGFGKSTIYEHVAAGNLRLKKLGKRSFIMADDLRAWLASLPERKAAPGSPASPRAGTTTEISGAV